MHAPAHRFGHGFGNAFKRNVHDIDLRHALEQFTREMRAAADAGR